MSVSSVLENIGRSARRLAASTTSSASGKPTTAICHGQWVMVSAGILKGKKATAVWNIHPDLANAGATVLDEPCVVDGNLITARFPYDLPRLVDALVKQLVK